MFDLHRLWLLRELSHRGTLAAVAEAHAYSTSSVSQQLRVLQAEAGVPLLEPTGRRVRLTAPARRLVARTETVLEILERARAELDAAATAAAGALMGTVRVAAFQTAAHAVVPGAIAALAASHPELRVELSVQEPEDALPALVARRFDLVLLEEFPGLPQRRRPEVEYRPLLVDRVRLARPAAQDGPDGPDGPDDGPDVLAGLAGRAWIMEPAGTAARIWATALCRTAGFEPDVRYETADLLLHAHLVRSGQAVAVLPDLLGLGDDPRIRLSALPGDPARQILTATRRGAAAGPAVAALRHALAHTGGPGAT